MKEADIDDMESLERMTASAKIIINAVGPYRFYGERVIQACIKSGTHHVDVSGEPQFMETMQLKYHDVAKEKGIYIISACGFDSIPADLGAVFLQKNFEGNFDIYSLLIILCIYKIFFFFDVGTVNTIESYMYTTEEGGPYPGATLHYGTYESAVYGLAHWNELKAIRSKLYPEKLPLMEPKLKTKYVIIFFLIFTISYLYLSHICYDEKNTDKIFQEHFSFLHFFNVLPNKISV